MRGKTLAQRTEKSGKTSKVRSFKADADMDLILDVAVAATGKSRAEIINEALRLHAADIIDEIMKEQDGHRQELVRMLARLKEGKEKKSS